MNSDVLTNATVGAAALIALAPYLDRLRRMNWRTHQPAVVGMHLAFAIWLGFVAFHGLVMRDLDDLRDLLAVAASACWIVTSHPTWRHGPPQHTESRPAAFDPAPISIRSDR